MKSNNPTPDVQTLVDLQNKAKGAKVGKWDTNAKVCINYSVITYLFLILNCEQS